MAYQHRLPDGTTVTVNEPQRGMFAPTLGGAVEYTFVHAVYRVLEVMGGALGSFLSGTLIEFLHRIEPELVSVASPLLDEALSTEGLPASLRTFLTALRHPKGQAAGAIAAGLAQQAGGAVVGSVLGALLAPLTYSLNRRLRPARPTLDVAFRALWRGAIDGAKYQSLLADLGYSDEWAGPIQAALMARVGEDVYLEAYRRGLLSADDVRQEFARRAISKPESDLLLRTAIQMLGVDDIIRAYYRGLLSESEARERLQQHGIASEDASRLLELSKVIPGVSDLVTMAVRDAWRDDVAQRWGYDEDYPTEFGEWTAKQGLSDEWARRYWRAHWELPSVTLGYEMLHRGIINEGEMLDLLKVSDYPKTWRERMIRASYSPLTRVDVRRMYGMGVLTRDEVVRAYRDLGYDATNAERLAEFTVRYEDRDGESKPEKYRELSRSLVEKAYRKGYITRPEAQTRLLGLRYTPEDVDFLLGWIDAESQLERTPDYDAEYLRDMRSVIEHAYSRRVMSRSEALDALRRLGFAPNESELLLSVLDFNNAAADKDARLKVIESAYVSRAITYVDAVSELGQIGISGAEQEHIFDTWDVQRNLRDRRLTEAQYRMAMQRGIISLEEYQESLRGLGYTERDIDILVRLAGGGEVA